MKSMDKFDTRINVMLFQSDKDLIDKIYDETKISPADFVRGLISEALNFYKENGYFVFPVKITPVNAVLFGKTESAVSEHGAVGTLKARIATPQEPITKLTKRSRK